MKIIASDYDGTLRHGDGICEKNRNAIKMWRNAGNLFGIVTGRGRDIIQTVIDENLEVDFMIAYNGADIYDHKGDIIKRTLGKSERLYELLPILLNKSGDWAEFITPDKTYYVTYGDESPGIRNTWVKREEIRDVKQFLQIQSLYKSNEEALETARRLNDNFSELVSALVNGNWINAPAAGINKATGMQEFAKIVSVKYENIYTIGDSYNDWDMIKAFNGFTVENGAEEIKKIARAVYKGVWELIEAHV